MVKENNVQLLLVPSFACCVILTIYLSHWTLLEQSNTIYCLKENYLPLFKKTLFSSLFNASCQQTLILGRSDSLFYHVSANKFMGGCHMVVSQAPDSGVPFVTSQKTDVTLS